MGGIVALAGGVGAARLLRGLVKLVKPEDVVVIGNIGDDLELFGLHISPDLDIVAYTLAGIVDEERGWGIAGDTFHCLEMLKKLGFEAWFRLGDRDLAIHIARTMMLREGCTLSEATRRICEMLGIKVRIIPVSDNPIRTRVKANGRFLDFQDYFVKRGAVDAVEGVMFEGADEAKPAPGVIEAIKGAKRIIICPSNPILSIAPILSVSGVREALRGSASPIVGVSPIIGGRAVKGPLVKVMECLGMEASAYGVANFYKGLISHFVIDRLDAWLKPRIERLGIKVIIADTLMKSLEDSVNLARVVLEAD
ncbi:MAG: 2-phospho-L-lactate transferase [Candidatus Parvarchaeota archaeon]|nr:2-phospho-L-lactate transferase [Candidatus Bathyarchaeota archaeon]